MKKSRHGGIRTRIRWTGNRIIKVFSEEIPEEIAELLSRAISKRDSLIEFLKILEEFSKSFRMNTY